MKRTEKQIMDRFDDKAMMIDPKFRSNLRSQVVGSSHSKKNQKISRHWLRLAMVPAVTAVFVAVFIGLNLNKSGDIKHPLQPQKVSAAELLQKSAHSNDQDVASTATFIESHSDTVDGPQAASCDVAGFGFGTGSFNTYLYRDRGGKVEAEFIKDSPSNNPTAMHSIYDDTDKQLFDGKEFNNVADYRTLADYFKARDYENDVPTIIPVDAQGNKIDLNTYQIQPTDLDGRSVYVFYSLSNPDSKDGKLACWPEGSNRDYKSETGTYLPPYYKPEAVRYVMDAETNRILKLESYIDKIAPENLFKTMTNSIEFSNKSAADALSIMKAAGFDQANAENELPLGGERS